MACPPAKNFTDHYKGQSGQTKPSKNDTSGELQKKESEKKLASNTVSKSNEKEEQFGSTGNNFKSTKESVKSTQQGKPGSKVSEQIQKTNSEIHVKKWVDYSTKYGLGYLLSDGSTGVYFNDSTKIIIDKGGDKFQYIEKKAGDKVDTVREYKLSGYPQ